MQENLRVIIVGGVACGPKTACRLKRLVPSAQITIFEKGRDISYGACGMPYYIAGMTPDIKALCDTPVGVTRDANFFKNVKGVEVICGKEVTAINRQEKTVTVKDVDSGSETTVPYDKLVLATGGHPVRPPIKGIEAKGVQHFHSLNDSRTLDAELQEGKIKKVALVGAGLIGIEMAEALIARDIEVTMIEMFDYIMPALLDEEIGRLAGKHMKAKGVNMGMGSPVSEFVTDSSGNLVAVKTKDNEYAADLALVAIGVQANNQLAVQSGLAIAPNRGILVNEYGQTSDADIYAGGDCVATNYIYPIMGRPLFTPQGSTANKEGRIIANHIAGMSEPFPGVLGTVICKAFDFNIGRTGLSERWARDLNLDVETVLWTGPDKPHYYTGANPLAIKLVVNKKDRKLLGCQITGPGDAAKRLDVAVTAISLGATLDQVAYLDLAYAPPYSPPIDPLNTAAHVLQNKLDGTARGISPLVAKEKIEKEDVTLLDVRTPWEFEEVGLPYDVVHIPLGAVRAKGSELPRDKEILAFCKLSLRGYEAQRILQAQGIENVCFIEGGVVGWPFELRTK